MKSAMIIGRITKDAVLESRTVKGDATPVTNFNVAVNTLTNKLDEQGRRIQTTDYYRITLWRNFATAMAPNLKKGRLIAVSGKDFALETWMDRQNQVHPTLHFTNPDIQLLDKKPESGADEPAEGNAVVAAPVDVDDLPFEV